jgi:16S rRNA (adenine1518-N6/adenine1519-N6)-dimethyltransferase
MTSRRLKKAEGKSGLNSGEAGHEISELLIKYKIQPSHWRGQHFLIDDEVYQQILTAAALKKSDIVLEVGAGLGTLTSRLGAEAGQVIALEIDKKLVAILQHHLAEQRTIKILSGDILKQSVKSLSIKSPYKVVANIPYYLTGKLLRKFLTEDIQPAAMTLLIQKEVAKRLVAPAGELSLVGISAQLYSSPRLVAAVRPVSFFPRPAVDSAVIQLDDIHPFPWADITEKNFWRVVKICFASPRKQLINNLRAGFPKLSRQDLLLISKNTKISMSDRAQDLDLESWHKLVKQLDPELTSPQAK